MISALRKQGIHSAEIARNLGRHRSTICREVQRNSARWDGHYRPSIAVERTSGRRSRSRKKSQFRPNDWRQVLELLHQDWSPEQISGHLRAAANTVDQPRDDLSAREARSKAWRSAVPAPAFLEKEVAQDLSQS